MAGWRRAGHIALTVLTLQQTLGSSFTAHSRIPTGSGFGIQALGAQPTRTSPPTLRHFQPAFRAEFHLKFRKIGAPLHPFIVSWHHTPPTKVPSELGAQLTPHPPPVLGLLLPWILSPIVPVPPGRSVLKSRTGHTVTILPCVGARRAQDRRDSQHVNLASNDAEDKPSSPSIRYHTFSTIHPILPNG
ncbi:hypothetical protein DFP72DRAFT_1058344 [Ephemerocybe angulata]|uniref:Secreted protein n=1 Tax=Ephemerocybe angulata TaxID=980116 RepID=A0A8H6IKP4_9AGAR|nr:hypothetical protein DFP72DRAFT_1058344 [Tulosesus angulatus]